MRGTDIRVNVDLVSLLGPRGFLDGPWMQVHGACITGADVAAWSYSVAFFASLLPFLVLCIGLSMLLTWGILGSVSWKSLSFSSNGLDTGCLVKRLPGLMLGQAVLFWFPLCLCQRELKFDMGVSSQQFGSGIY